jgi:hypothetical protein
MRMQRWKFLLLVVLVIGFFATLFALMECICRGYHLGEAVCIVTMAAQVALALLLVSYVDSEPSHATHSKR